MVNFKDNLERIETAVVDIIPFVASLLDQARILTRDLDGGIARVDSNEWIYVDPDRINQFGIEDQVFTMAHEVMHCPPAHGSRRANKKHGEIWNLAADCVVNNQLSEVMKVPEWAVTPDDIAKIPKIKADPEEISRMSDNEVYELIVDSLDDPGGAGDEDDEEKSEDNDDRGQGKNGGGDSQGDEDEGKGTGSGEKEGDKPGSAGQKHRMDKIDSNNKLDGDLSGEELEGEVVQEGGDHNDLPGEEKQEEWKDELSKAAEMQRKTKGELPAGLERMVEEITRPDLNIRSLIKHQINRGMGTLVINDWRRSSRKHPDLPGNKMLTTPTIWTLIDTSGSISSDELKLFLGVIYGFSSKADISIYPWDADSYEKIEVSRKDEVIRKVANSLKGGGGTVISPVLDKLGSDIENGDITAILTDGHISDIGMDKTVEYMRTISEKSSSSFILTTDREVDVEGWKVLSLD